MAKKTVLWRGKAEEDVAALSLKEFAEIVPARERRKIKRGFTEQEKILLRKVEKNEKKLFTHCRDMIIVPLMLGKTISIHNGKEFVKVAVTLEMLGHRLGEFSMSKRGVQHNAPGIGATRSSAAISVK